VRCRQQTPCEPIDHVLVHALLPMQAAHADHEDQQWRVLLTQLALGWFASGFGAFAVGTGRRL